ncbi:MAG: TetR/AcrR family transcriptional regulator [Lachnospiraceae bacterium]|jgi:AcrR family transcriptional regulator
MPKQRITKEMVVNAAFEIARSSGMEQVLVKNIADRIGCSVQPIYSYCKNMEGLRRDVTDQVSRFIQEYIAARVDKADLFRSTGNAYIQLAKEEPNLFKIFILRQRDGIASLDDLYQLEAGPHVADYIAGELQISGQRARQLHLHMLIYTIGLGTIFSITTPGISADEIFAQQDAAYEAFLKQVLDEEKDCEAE